MNYINIILDIFRKPNILLFILFLSSTLLTFNVFGLKEIIGLDKLTQTYITIVGIVFLITLSCLCFLLIKFTYVFLKNHIQSALSEKEFEKNLDSMLKKLSDKEIVVMCQFLIQQSRIIWLPYEAPEVNSLTRKNLISISSQNGRMMSNGMNIFHYFVDESVLNKFELFLNTEILKEPKNDDFKEFIYKNSPSYLSELERSKKLWNLN